MKWLVKAGCLVAKGVVTWQVEADSMEEAESKGFALAMESRIADCGDVDIEPLEEDKQLICNALLNVLELTRNLYDVFDLKYDAATETVTAYFTSGYTKVANVAADSGTAMIKDIINQII